MSDKEQLLSFGFPEAKVNLALSKTKHAGLQPALDWLVEHENDPIEVIEAQSAEAAAAEAQEEATFKKLDGEGTAKSLVCTDCGKKFRSTASAEYHATKSGHENFEESTEEIKPLTEEEKKQKLEELRAAMAVKRAAQAKLDVEQAKQNEAIRRKAGKEQSQYKEEMKKKEAEKEAAARKREKELEAAARARVKAQIEADKKERAEKAAREKALRAGQAPPISAADAKPSGPSTVAAASKSSSTTARLQIRLPDGSPPLTTTLAATDTLNTLADWVSSQRPEFASGKFAMTFPRKTFVPADMTKTLAELSLTPSAALILQM